MTTYDAYLPMEKWSRLLNEESNMYQFWNTYAWIWYAWVQVHKIPPMAHEVDE